MRLIKTSKDRYQFHLPAREKELLLHVLSLYPQIPSGHHRLSKSDGGEESNQRLLDDALSESRSHNKKQLESLLSDPRALKHGDDGWHLTLRSQDVEWLLQVLNDIRVGSWICLGSPEMPLKELKAEEAPSFWAMETAGYFQMRFLELIED